MFLLINKFSSSWLFMFERTVLVAESGVLCIIYSSLKKEETVGHYLCALCCFSYRYLDIDAMFARSRRVHVSPSWNAQEISCYCHSKKRINFPTSGANFLVCIFKFKKLWSLLNVVLANTFMFSCVSNCTVCVYTTARNIWFSDVCVTSLSQLALESSQTGFDCSNMADD